MYVSWVLIQKQDLSILACQSPSKIHIQNNSSVFYQNSCLCVSCITEMGIKEWSICILFHSYHGYWTTMKIHVSLLLAVWFINCFAVARKNIQLKSKEKFITFSEEEILSVNGSTKGLNRIKNADNYGKGPQQVYYNLR